MTTDQIHLINVLGAIVLVALAIVTRAPLRRVAGAVAGAATGGTLALVLIPLGERVGLWRIPIRWEPAYLLLLLLNFAVGGYTFLLTWRIARRFAGRGLITALLLAAIIGPFRDSWYMNRFPEWGTYAPGVAPMFGVSGLYVLIGIVGHGVMRLFAGPAEGDTLARRPWERAE